MKITAIEPTPSPNTMKLTLNESLPGGQSNNYTKQNIEHAPEEIQLLFNIEGIKGVYHVADFLALEREPKADWERLLSEARAVFGEDIANELRPQGTDSGEQFGEVGVQVQMFRGIPMQVKVTAGTEEKRTALAERFTEAAFSAAGEQANIVLERKWEERNVRYGTDLEQIGREVAEEISAAYDEDRLQALVRWANSEGEAEMGRPKAFKVTEGMLDDPDWKRRFQVLDQMDPTEDDIPVLDKALGDEKQSIRRLATTLLGMIETSATLPYLYKALKDRSVAVRRTAGDALSDLGDPAAMDEMIKSLKDKNKIVRWRAAMFLYEVGDDSAIPALKEAVGDPEFEVDMQIQIALERIEGGEEAKGSVWKQMTESVRASSERSSGKGEQSS